MVSSSSEDYRERPSPRTPRPLPESGEDLTAGYADVYEHPDVLASSATGEDKHGQLAGNLVHSTRRRLADAELEAANEVERLEARQTHAKQHAWWPPHHETTPPGATKSHRTRRIPREHDAAALVQALQIKDALLLHMEQTLLPPSAEHASTVMMDRRSQGLIANARRREAALALKCRALEMELGSFRRREREAVAINTDLRRRLRDALADNDAVRLRHEVRTLRADLSSALAREHTLQGALLHAQLLNVSNDGALERSKQQQQAMTEDADYFRHVAVHVAHAANALSPYGTFGGPGEPGSAGAAST